MTETVAHMDAESPGLVDFLTTRIWDYLLVFLVVVMTVMGPKVFGLVQLAVIFPLIMLAARRDFSTLFNFRRSDLIFIAFVMQYLVWHYFIAKSYPLSDLPSPVRPIERPSMWFFGIIASVFVIWRFASMQNIKEVWRVVAPVGLAVCFAIMLVDYSTDYLGTECRAKAFVFNPIIPPVFFTMFTIGSFIDWTNLSRREKQIRYLLVAMAVIFATAFAGSRMILIVQVLAFGCLAFLIPLKKEDDGRWKTVIWIGAAGFLGLVAGMVIDAITQCGFSNRMLNLFFSVALLDTGQDVSVGARAELYVRAIEAVRANPWVGYGITYEKILSAPWPHVHNQYLSWMIWGGVTSLVSGVGFFIAASVAPALSRSKDAYAIIIATAGIFLVNSFTDTLLYHPDVDIQYFLGIAMFFALGRTLAQQPNVAPRSAVDRKDAKA